MSRTLSDLIAAASAGGVIRPVYLVQLDYASGMVRAASTPFNLTIDGVVWMGLGNLGAIGAVQEGAELQNYSLALTLTGVPSDLVAVALGEQYQGRDARIYLALLDEDHAVIDAPLLIFRGRMDTQDIEVGDTATITLTVQSRLADWERPRVRRYTNEDQQAVFAGDRGFEFVPQMAEKTIYWGRG